MPQATIKLQTAPTPVVPKKPIVSATAKSEEKDEKESKDEVRKESKAAALPLDGEESSAGGVPLPLLMAAAALALVAFGIQVWLFIS